MTVLHLLRIRKDALLFCLLVVALPACALTAEREQRHTQLPADAWQPPATEYNKKLDGSGSWDVAPPDVPLDAHRLRGDGRFRARDCDFAVD